MRMQKPFEVKRKSSKEMLKDNSMILTGKKPENVPLIPNVAGYPRQIAGNLTTIGCHICRTAHQ